VPRIHASPPSITLLGASRGLRPPVASPPPSMCDPGRAGEAGAVVTLNLPTCYLPGRAGGAKGWSSSWGACPMRQRLGRGTLTMYAPPTTRKRCRAELVAGPRRYRCGIAPPTRPTGTRVAGRGATLRTHPRSFVVYQRGRRAAAGTRLPAGKLARNLAVARRQARRSGSCSASRAPSRPPCSGWKTCAELRRSGGGR